MSNSEATPEQPETPALHKGVIFTDDIPFGVPVVHVCAIPKREYFSVRGGCLPEKVATYCGNSKNRFSCELAKITDTSVVCHECYMALPERHWDCLLKVYRDPVFRMQISKAATNDLSSPHNRSLLTFKAALHHTLRDEPGGGA